MQTMRNKLTTIILVLAIISGVSAVTILFFPLGRVGEEFSNRATLSSAISTLFALISGIIAIVVTTWVSSSDYQAGQAVKSDTARLLAGLRSIMLKGVVISQLPKGGATKLDFQEELDIINKFLSSTTAFAYWSWEGYKSEAAKGHSEEWRLFFLYLVDLLDSSDDYRHMTARALAIEKMLTGLTEGDIIRISGYLSDLSEAVGKFRESRERSVVIKALDGIYSVDRDQESVRKMLLYLKDKGIKDPNIDLFLGVMSPQEDQNSVKQVKEALAAGADPSMTDGQLLAKYREELKDFDSSKGG